MVEPTLGEGIGDDPSQAKLRSGYGCDDESPIVVTAYNDSPISRISANEAGVTAVLTNDVVYRKFGAHAETAEKRDSRYPGCNVDYVTVWFRTGSRTQSS